MVPTGVDAGLFMVDSDTRFGYFATACRDYGFKGAAPWAV